MKYYWIDPSCGTGKGVQFEYYILEARMLARRALQRLQSPTDTDFARVFNIIFKMPKTSTAAFPRPDVWYNLNGMNGLDRRLREKVPIPEQIMAALRYFAEDWDLTEYRQMAHVRIYNNSAARMAYDPRTDMCRDPINHIVAYGDPISAACNSQAVTLAETRGKRGPDGKEEPKRCTMNFYPDAWKALKLNVPISIEALKQDIARKRLPGHPKALDITQLGPYLLTMTIAHEWMNTHAHGFSDGSSTGWDGAETAGWGYIMKETNDMAYENAEAFALLVIAAGFADLRPYGETQGGFTLDRVWDEIPGTNDPEVKNKKWDPRISGNDAAKGR